MIDFSKAFDSVDHAVLVSKLVQLNLPSFVINWICSFLAGGGQQCKVLPTTILLILQGTATPQRSACIWPHHHHHVVYYKS